jgi:hypothetical protein
MPGQRLNLSAVGQGGIEHGEIDRGDGTAAKGEGQPGSRPLWEDEWGADICQSGGHPPRAGFLECQHSRDI